MRGARLMQWFSTDRKKAKIQTVGFSNPHIESIKYPCLNAGAWGTNQRSP